MSEMSTRAGMISAALTEKAEEFGNVVTDEIKDKIREIAALIDQGKRKTVRTPVKWAEALKSPGPETLSIMQTGAWMGSFTITVAKLLADIEYTLKDGPHEVTVYADLDDAMHRITGGIDHVSENEIVFEDGYSVPIDEYLHAVHIN